MAELGTASFKIGVDIGDFKNKVEQLKTGFAGAGKTIEANAASIRKAGLGIAAFGTAVVAGLGFAVKSAASFEKGMAKVSTLVDTNTESMKKYSNGILKLGQTVPQSLSELTEGMYQAISAGVSLGDSIEFVGGAAELAVGGFTEVNVAVDGMTTVMNAYGDAQSDVNHVMDVFITTQNQGKTTVGALASNLGKVIPIAANAGVSFEDLSAAMAALTAGGLSTEEAVTALKAVLTGYVKPAKEAKDAAAAMGIELNASTLKSRGLSGAMDDVSRATGGNIDAVSALFPNVRALTGALSLSGKMADKYKTSLDAMKDSAGAAKEAFDKMKEALELKIQMLGSSVEILKVKIGDVLLPVTKKLVDAVSFIVNGISDWIDENPMLTRSIVMAAAAIGTLAAAIGPILILLPNIVSGIKTVGWALKGLLGATNPIGLVILAVGVLFAAWSANFLGLRDLTSWVIDAIGASLEMLTDRMSDMMGGIGSIIDEGREYFLKGQIALIKAFGGETRALENELVATQALRQSREEWSSAKRQMTWSDYFKRRRETSKAAAEEMMAENDEVTKDEIDNVNKLAAAHEVAEEKVREFRRMTTDDMIETGNARIEKEKETYSIMEDLGEREVENFQAMMNDKIADALRYSEQMGMSLDEFDAKAFEVYQKIKTGHADSLTEQELRMVGYVEKITGEEGLGGLQENAQGVYGAIEEDVKASTEKMTGFWGSSIDSISGFFSSLTSSVAGIFSGIGGGIGGVLKKIGGLFTGEGGLMSQITGGVSGITGAISGLFGGGASGALGSIASLIPGGSFISALIGGDVGAQAIKAVQGVVGGIKSALSGLFGGSDRATIEEAIETSRNLSAEEQTAADARRAADIASDSVESAAGRMGSFDTTATNLTDLSAADAAQAAALAEREIAAQRAAQNAEKNAAADQEYATAAAERTAARRVAADAEIAAQNAATEAEKARLMGEMFAKQRLAREADKAFNAMVAERKKEEEAAAEQAAWWALSPKERKAAKAAEEQAEKGREYAELSDARDAAMRAAGMSTFARGGNVMQNMFARLHAREMVLPPDLSDFIRRSAKNAAGAAGAVAVNIAAGAVNISGVGNSVLDNTDNLADMISMKLADRVLRRVQVSGA